MNAALAFRVVGSAANRREVVSFRKAMTLYAIADPAVQPELPAYLSAFSYPRSFREYVARNGGSIAGYAGPIGVPDILWDIDRDGDLDGALQATRKLASFVAERYAIEPLVHFSGSNGFHVSVPTGGAIEPSPENHRIMRSLILRVAGEIGVTVDDTVQLATQLWRAPNSRHSKTGLYKVRIDLDDLLYLTIDQIRGIAAVPVPYDHRVSTSGLRRLISDWNEAAEEVRHVVPLSGRRNRRSGTGDTRINPLTWSLVTDPTAIREGGRHRTIFSAAADLAGFPTVEDLITALLTSPGLDTGLPPREVARQIRCGIELGRRHSGEGETA
jgi:hypothetical protein